MKKCFLMLSELLFFLPLLGVFQASKHMEMAGLVVFVELMAERGKHLK